MTAEILTIGSELLTPGRTDTNAAYLIEKITATGESVLFRGTVGDDRLLIAGAARQALSRSGLIFVTGGLGPTSDDVTREGFALALGCELELNPAILARIRAQFASRGREMPNVNRRQAMILEGAEVLTNEIGTAPGQRLRYRSGVEARFAEIFLLPGPPRELRDVFEKQVLPLLERRGATVSRVKRIFVTGLRESEVEERIGDVYERLENPRTTILARPGQIELHLTARAKTGQAAMALLEELTSRFRARLGSHVFSENGASLEQVVGELLLAQEFTLAVAESCTGGLISHRLTEVPGSSRYFEAGFVTYSNESKVAELGVSGEQIRNCGPVSEEVARAMAIGARRRASTDLALAITGFAGPDPGNEDGRTGLVFIAIDEERESVVQKCLFDGDRSRIKWQASQAALNLVRRRLMPTGD